MSANTTKGLKEQRERRKRINRIKVGIIVFILVWMLVCMLVSIGLCVKVTSLQNQVDVLTERILEAEQNAIKLQKEVETHQNVEQPTDATSSSENPNTEEQVNAEAAHEAVRVHLAVEDNLIQPGEIPKVYLTFDDGPSTNTEAILDTLRAYNVKATFFVTGQENEELTYLYKKIIDEGHSLAMHSYSHNYSTIYESVEAFSEDFHKIQDYIYDLTGQTSTIYRFPGGSSNQVSNIDMNEFIDFLGEEGVIFYDWNVACGDATAQIYTAEELTNNVMNDVVNYKNSVVLMHDASNRSTTVEALEQILAQLDEIGAEVLPLTSESEVIHHTSLYQIQ